MASRLFLKAEPSGFADGLGVSGREREEESLHSLGLEPLAARGVLFTEGGVRA